MGRRDAVPFTRELAAEWRRLGAEVTFEPGWETRSNGYAADYEGAIVHHTAVASSQTNPFPARRLLVEGRSDLPGPLCNSAGPWCPPDAPRIHVIAANPANHAGASGGRSMGPLPVTTGFNRRVWGHEVDYAGTVPMSPGQHRAALICGRGVVNVLGRSVEYVRAHAETSVTGKWDPGYAMNRTIDMAAFRRDAAAIGEDDMPLTQDDLNKVSVVVRDQVKAVLLTPVIDWDLSKPGAEASVAQQTADNAKAIAAVDKKMDELMTLVRGLATGGPVDVQAVADQLTIVPKV